MSTKMEFCGKGLTKAQIRSKILLRLKIQKEDTREVKSRVIQAKLFRLRVFKKAKAVMFYIAFGGEVNTQEMIKEARRIGKTVAVPVCRSKKANLKPCILDSNVRLKNGLYGTKEPAVERFVRLKDLDLIVVPGIAFDRKGRRLGRGKGCYDRFLKRIPRDTPSIGLGFDFQILPFIPATSRDVSVSRVIFA